MKHTKLTISILMVLLFVSACAPNNNDTDEEVTLPNENEVETPNEENDETTHYHSDFQVNVNETEIYNNFLEAHDGVKVTELELSLKNNAYIYEIEGYDFAHEYEAEYNADTGELIELETDSLDSDEKEEFVKDDLAFIKIYFDKAFKDAGDNYYLKEWTLKHKNDMRILEIELLDENNQEIEYKYNIDTDELIEKDQE